MFLDKCFFATSALVASAGIAAADITISGDARMGVVNTDSATNADNETQFNSRLRITFTASGVTDGGLEFGGSIRADNAAASGTRLDLDADDCGTPTLDAEDALNQCLAETGGGVNGQAGSVYISGTFGKITMGDIDSAHEAAVGDLHGVGYTMSSNEMGFAGGGDDEGASYTYTVNGVTVYASMGQPNAASADDEQALGISFAINGITVAAGTADDGNTEETALAVSGSFGDLGLKAIVLDRDNDATVSGETGFSATYAIDTNLSVAAYHRTVENVAAADTDFTGVGFSYDLGGGATLAGGYTDTTNDVMDLGLKFAF